MPNETPDLKTIWKNQPTETHTLTMKLIQSKVRELRAKTRAKLLGALAGPAAAGFLYALGIKFFPALQTLLHAGFVLALAWSLAGLYFLSRGMWGAAMPGDAGLSTGLEFCREEIARRRTLLRRLLFWSLAPMLLAIATFILALSTVGIFPEGLPFVAAVAMWVLGYFILRFREQRELARELLELDHTQ
jgi:hypothetical protein